MVGRAETLSSIFFIGSLLAYSAATRKLFSRRYSATPVLFSSSWSHNSLQNTTTTTTTTSSSSSSTGSPTGMAHPNHNSVLVTGGGGSYTSTAAVAPAAATSTVTSVRPYSRNGYSNSSQQQPSSVGYSMLGSVHNGLGLGCVTGYGGPFASLSPGGNRCGNRTTYRSSSGSRCGTGGNTQWGWVAVCVAMACCAMLCKEQGITVMAVCVLYELVVVQKVRFNKAKSPCSADKDGTDKKMTYC